MSCTEIVETDVIVTHFINPHLFWFRVNDAQSQVDDQLVRYIELKLTSMYHCEELMEPPKVDIGDNVVVNFIQWNRCIRAEVICLQQIKSDTLHYILWASDHGFPLCSSVKYIRYLPTNYMSTTSPIMRGGLDDVQPAEKRAYDSLSSGDTMQLTLQWQWAACVKLEQMLQDAKHIQMTQTFTHNGNIWGQLLIMRSDGSVIDAADFLVKDEVALRGGRSFQRKVGKLHTTKKQTWLTNDGTNLFQINSAELQQLVEAKSPLLFTIGDLECMEKKLQSVDKTVSSEFAANSSGFLSPNNFNVNDFGAILYEAVLNCIAPKTTNERGKNQIVTMKQNPPDSEQALSVSTGSAKAAVKTSAFCSDKCNVMESWCGLPLEQLTQITINSWVLSGVSDDFYAQRSDKVHMAKMMGLEALIGKYVNEHKAVSQRTFKTDWFRQETNCIVKYQGRYGRAKTYGTYVEDEDGISARHYIFFLCDYADFVDATAEDLFDNFLYETADQIVSFTPYQAVHVVLAGIYVKQNAVEQYKIENAKFLVCAVDEHCTAGSGAACMAMVTENELEIRSFAVLIYKLECHKDFWAIKMLNIDLLEKNFAVIDANTANYLEFGLDGVQSEKGLQPYLNSQMTFIEKYSFVEQCTVYVAQCFEKKPIDEHAIVTNCKNIDDLDSDDCQTLVNFPQPTGSTGDDRSMHMFDCDDLCIDLPDDSENDPFLDYEEFDLHEAADEAGTGVDFKNGHVVDLWTPRVQISSEGSLNNYPHYVDIWGAANSVKPSAELPEIEIMQVKSCEDNEERVANYQQAFEQIGIQILEMSTTEQETEPVQHHEILYDCGTGLNQKEDADAKEKFDNKPTAEENTGIKQNKIISLYDFGLEPMEESSVKGELMKPAEDETDSSEGKVYPAQLQHSIEAGSDADGGRGDGAVDSLDESVVSTSLKTADNGGGDQAILQS